MQKPCSFSFRRIASDATPDPRAMWPWRRPASGSMGFRGLGFRVQGFRV